MCHALSQCRTNKAKTKRCLSIKWQIQTEANQSEPFFHIPCPCGLTDQAKQLTLGESTRNFWDCLQTSYSRVFRSFPLMTQLMAFQNLFIVNFKSENFQNPSACARTTHTHTRQAYVYIILSFQQLIILENVWSKLFLHKQHNKLNKNLFYEIALLRNCFIVPCKRFSCPLLYIPKDFHQSFSFQGNTFVFIKVTNYCNKLKY